MMHGLGAQAVRLARTTQVRRLGVLARGAQKTRSRRRGRAGAAALGPRWLSDESRPKAVSLGGGPLSADAESELALQRQADFDPYAYAIEMSEAARPEGVINVDGCGHWGFFVNNEFIPGSVFLFQEVALSWDATTMEDLTPERFAVMDFVRPQLDLILIGTGKYTERIPKELLAELSKVCPVEAMGSYHACSTFNLLSDEGRIVAAAILAMPDEDEED